MRLPQKQPNSENYQHSSKILFFLARLKENSPKRTNLFLKNP